MAQRIENMKSIPIKNYDFQVDFKVSQEDVMQNFLDPNENKHISIPKRPMSAKQSTWGTTPKSPTKKFQTKAMEGPNLAIKGTANPDSEETAADNPLSANIFHFRSHLPVKKLSDNPKMALSMMKKKTIGTKSERVFQGPDSANDDDLKEKLLANARNNPSIKALIGGMTAGKKLTAKGANMLKEVKIASALKSSGAGHGFFQKRILAEIEEKKNSGEGKIEKKEMSRPKSAIVASAVGFMQNLKKEKKLKPPKKPQFLIDNEENEDIENNDDNIPNDDEENNGDVVEEEEEEVKPKSKKGGNQGLLKLKKAMDFDDNMFQKEEEDNVGTESMNPMMKNRPQSAKQVKPLPKRKKVPAPEEDYEIENVEPIDGADTEENRYNQRNEEVQEIYDEDDFEQENQEEEQEEQEQPKESIFPKIYRSNLANMLNQLQQNVLVPSNEPKLDSDKKKPLSGKNSAQKKKVVEFEEGTKPSMEGHKVKQLLGAAIKKGTFTPYSYTSTVDGDTAEMHRNQVTEEISDYLQKADEKRQKKFGAAEILKKIRKEPKETNEYTDRIESVNSRLKGSLQSMQNIVLKSKVTTALQKNIIEIDSD